MKTTIIIIAACLVVACGQKGDLYLPDDSNQSTEQSEALT
jgi:predicted small lipoprotein YifL